MIMSAACTLTCLLVGAICVNLEESALPIKLISTLHPRGVELEVSVAVMTEVCTVAWAGCSRLQACAASVDTLPRHWACSIWYDRMV